MNTKLTAVLSSGRESAQLQGTFSIDQKGQLREDHDSDKVLVGGGS
jgi:hypothetical protein